MYIHTYIYTHAPPPLTGRPWPRAAAPLIFSRSLSLSLSIYLSLSLYIYMYIYIYT